MNLSKFRTAWIRAHKGYERKSYSTIRKAFRDIALKIPFDSINEVNYKAVIEMSVFEGELEKAYVNMYSQIGLVHGNRIGKGINRDIKNFNGFEFETEFLKNIYNWVLQNVGSRITSVKESYIEYLQKIISDGFKDGKTVVQMAKEMQTLVKRRDFYRWQALRIARTETTAAANRGAIYAGRTSRLVMDKVWISAHDARTRRRPDDAFDHYQMHLKKVALGEPFNVNGELLDYPGSPTTANGSQSSGANVINCRCTVAEIPRRDSNGRLMRI